MNKRFIGGACFVAIFFLCTLTELYPLFYIFTAVVGVYEIYNITSKSDKSPWYGYLYLVIFLIGMFCLYLITKNNPAQMIYLSLIVMFADSSAYFVGRKFGRHKLSSISPNKTIEGVIGGYIGGFIFSYLTMTLLAMILPENIAFIRTGALADFQFTDTFLMGMIVVLIIVLLSVCGDLYESSVKRMYNVKDSGNIIYGHGGILDRMDSWVTSGIFLYIYLYFFDFGG